MSKWKDIKLSLSSVSLGSQRFWSQFQLSVWDGGDRLPSQGHTQLSVHTLIHTLATARAREDKPQAHCLLLNLLQFNSILLFASCTHQQWCQYVCDIESGIKKWSSGHKPDGSERIEQINLQCIGYWLRGAQEVMSGSVGWAIGIKMRLDISFHSRFSSTTS